MSITDRMKSFGAVRQPETQANTSRLLRALCALSVGAWLLPAGGLAAVQPPAQVQALFMQLVARLPQDSNGNLPYDRWEILRLAQRLPHLPPIPSQALEMQAKGLYLFKHASPSNGASDYTAAANAFRQASLIAPWVPDYYYDLGLARSQAASQKGGSGDAAGGAAYALHWYLMARPRAPDARQVIRRIGTLEAKAGDLKDEDIGWLPLLWASSWGDAAAVRSVINSGINLNSIQWARRSSKDYGETEGHVALWFASVKDSVPVATLLVDHGVSINSQNREFGDSALIFAAKNGYLDIVRFLVAHQADINAVDRRGDTPLIVAAKNGQLTVGRYLVSRGADINAVDQHGHTAVYWAITNDDFTLASYFIKRGGNINSADDVSITRSDLPDFTRLMSASMWGKMRVVHFLIAHHADINATTKSGSTALDIAVSAGNLPMIKYMVASGADVNEADRGGDTPLMLAVEGGRAWKWFDEEFEFVADTFTFPKRNHSAIDHGSPSIVKYLIAKGADIDRTDASGDSPLILASRYGHSNVVKFLALRGAKVNDVNKRGDTALYYAAARGDTRIVKYLIMHQANVNVQNKAGTTPLDAGAGYGYLGVVKLLIAAGANVNGKGSFGTPMIWASAGLMVPDSRGSKPSDKSLLDVVQYLIANHASLVTDYGFTPLMAAASTGRLPIVEFLVSRIHMNVNAVDKSGGTALMYAAESPDNVEVLQYLVTNGAKPNQAAKDGDTPLMVVAGMGLLNNVKFLVGAGANLHARNKKGQTALDFARLYKKNDVANFLISQGVNQHPNQVH